MCPGLQILVEIEMIACESGILPVRIKSAGAEAVVAFRWREGVGDAADGGPETLDGALGGLSQERLELGEGVLDRVEVGA
jgi:hypothetical protein